MANWFNRVQRIPKVRHSVNDISNDYKTSLRIGEAVPVYLEEIVPTDKYITLGNEIYLRFSPLLFPLMHRIKIKTHNFFTPLRIIIGDDNYEKYLAGQELPSGIFSLSPAADGHNPFENTVFDYLAVDINVAQPDSDDPASITEWTLVLENPVPVLAYFCIMRDWFCDSVLESTYMSSVDDLINAYRAAMTAGSTQVDLTGYLLPDWEKTYKVSYSKDYFNTARPSPQLGPDQYVLNRPLMVTSNGTDETGDEVTLSAFNAGQQGKLANVLGYDGDANSFEINEATTIRELWRKEALQMFDQHDNSFGPRIREKLAAHWGVLISDKRLQISQYCGGSSSYAQISEVIQTSSGQSAESDTPLGTFAGKATAYNKGRIRNYFMEEHGFMMTILTLVPDNGYCNGMDRLWFKKSVYDTAIPEFNNIGWQEIYNGEIFANGSSQDKEAFGYQPRYSEYRSHISRCTGSFRKSPLLGWHLNRNFDFVPTLNFNFIKVADTDRIFNYSQQDSGDAPIYLDCWTTGYMSRPITKEPDSMHIY